MIVLLRHVDGDTEQAMSFPNDIRLKAPRSSRQKADVCLHRGMLQWVETV